MACFYGGLSHAEQTVTPGAVGLNACVATERAPGNEA
jgi:hypothetical protein